MRVYIHIATRQRRIIYLHIADKHKFSYRESIRRNMILLPAIELQDLHFKHIIVFSLDFVGTCLRQICLRLSKIEHRQLAVLVKFTSVSKCLIGRQYRLMSRVSFFVSNSSIYVRSLYLFLQLFSRFFECQPKVFDIEFCLSLSSYHRQTVEYGDIQT